MRKRRVEKLENRINQNKDSNIVFLSEGIDKDIEYRGKKYRTKEQLEKDYPYIEFDYATIVYENGEILIHNQKDIRLIEVLQEFEANY